MILFLRTDTMNPTIGLLDGQRELERHTWPAGRQLSNQLLGEIESLLVRHQLNWQNLTGIIVFAGPGSFTGLRIGVSVANALGYGLNLPVVAASGEDWLTAGAAKLTQTKGFRPTVPEYGQLPHIS